MTLAKLVGQSLDGGWVITAQRRPDPTATGGCFSHGFYARNAAGTEVFVKVLDIRLRAADADPLKDLQLRLQRFNYESDIASACAEDRLTRVAHAIGGGILSFGPSGTEQYPYLVFERAQGDLRNQVERSRRLPPWLSYQVLHHVAIAIRQLHAKNIAHQDLKPSNVLDFGTDGHKVGDFGSAHARARPRPGPALPIAGDPGYAPPEQHYQYAVDDWVSRRLMADVYHLGSLALFLLTGDGATSQLAKELAVEHHWEVWTGSAIDILPHLRRATADLIARVTPDQTSLTEQHHLELIQILHYLLEPDPNLRGFPGDRAEGLPYGMQRLISKFDVFAKDARLNARRAQHR